MPPYSDMNNSHSCCTSSDGGTHSPPATRPLHAQPSSRPQLRPLAKSESNAETHADLLRLAASELESMRSCSRGSELPLRRASVPPSSNDGSSSNSGGGEEAERSFPPACLALLHSLKGNSRCHDCSSPSATWASVSFGIALCLQCSGKHRGLGVQTSFVKSMALDAWKRREILAMLEGGNGQLHDFFDRHEMGTKGSKEKITTSGAAVEGLDRYRTKAASFYRQHLGSHAKRLAEGGIYQGREASRENTKKSSKHGKSSSSKSPKIKRKKSRGGDPPLETVKEKNSLDSSGHSSSGGSIHSA